MRAISNFLYQGVCRFIRNDYDLLIQWFRTLYLMTEFTREHILIVVLNKQAKETFLLLLQNMYGDGYSEPIINSEDINAELIKDKLVIPIVAKEDNYLSLKMALLDYHSFMHAGKFIVITSKQSIAEVLRSDSFKVLGNNRDLPLNMSHLCELCVDSIKKDAFHTFVCSFMK